MFYGRKKDLEWIEKSYSDDRKIILTLCGLKGVGKTALIKEFLKTKPDAVCFEAARTTSESNLSEFTDLMSGHFRLNRSLAYKSWNEAFRDLASLIDAPRFVLAIDNYDALAETDSSFHDRIAELYCNAPDSLLIILCGDNPSAFENICNLSPDICGKRITPGIDSQYVHELEFRDRLPFLDGVPDDDKMNYLTLFGGYPFYLELIDKSISFEDNLKSLFFSPSGFLFDYPETLEKLYQEDAESYDCFFATIARGNNTAKDIIRDLNLTEDGIEKLNSFLSANYLVSEDVLILSPYVSYLTIADPVLRFWHSFIYGKKDAIERNGEAVFNEAREAIREYLDRECEDAVVSYAVQIYLEEKENEDFYDGIYRTTIPSREPRGLLECAWVPYVVHDMFVCISHAGEPLTNDMQRIITRNFDNMPDSFPVLFYIFSPCGYAPDLEKRDYIRLLTADNMFH